MTTQPLNRLVQIHKAIAHPVRLRLLGVLRKGPLCVCQMMVIVKLAASTVSEHLSELRNAGLVADRKDGRWVEYRLTEGAIRNGVLDAVWPFLDEDPDARADTILVNELRRIPLDELCDAGLDLSRIKRPKLAATLAKAEAVRCCESGKS